VRLGAGTGGAFGLSRLLAPIVEPRCHAATDRACLLYPLVLCAFVSSGRPSRPVTNSSPLWEPGLGTDFAELLPLRSPRDCRATQREMMSVAVHGHSLRLHRFPAAGTFVVAQPGQPFTLHITNTFGADTISVEVFVDGSPTGCGEQIKRAPVRIPDETASVRDG
jgi:hypothetical protein